MNQLAQALLDGSRVLGFLRPSSVHLEAGGALANAARDEAADGEAQAELFEGDKNAQIAVILNHLKVGSEERPRAGAVRALVLLLEKGEGAKVIEALSAFLEDLGHPTDRIGALACIPIWSWSPFSGIPWDCPYQSESLSNAAVFRAVFQLADGKGGTKTKVIAAVLDRLGHATEDVFADAVNALGWLFAHSTDDEDVIAAFSTLLSSNGEVWRKYGEGWKVVNGVWTERSFQSSPVKEEKKDGDPFPSLLDRRGRRPPPLPPRPTRSRRS